MESAGKERRLGGPTGGWRRRREIRAEKRKNFDDFRRETPSLIQTRIPSKTPRIRPRNKNRYASDFFIAAFALVRRHSDVGSVLTDHRFAV